MRDLPSSIDMPSDPIIVSFSVNRTGDFSGDENTPSNSSIPCSSRRPSLSVIPVRLEVISPALSMRVLVVAVYLPCLPTLE
jgi:hypothetical protein